MTAEKRNADGTAWDVDHPIPLGPSKFGEALAAEDPTLLTYLRAVRAHWLVFVAVVVACTGATSLLTSIRPPMYEAAARVLVAPLPASDTTFIGVQVVRESSGDPTRSVQTAAALLQSGSAAEATSAVLGGRLTAAEVADAVHVEPVGGSNVLAVRAKASTAQDASAVATSYARSALALRTKAVRAQIAAVLDALEAQRLASQDSDASMLTARIVQLRASQAQGDPSLSLEQDAAPGQPTGVSRWLILALSVLAGAALGATAAILFELARRRVRDTEEASALFPLPVLARVPRLQVRDRQPVMNGRLHLDAAAHDAFQRVYRELAQEPRGGAAIIVTSASSGDGKSTAAVCLAATMALAGRRVILLDCDLRNPRAAHLLGMGSGGRRSTGAQADLGELLVPVPGLPMSFLAVNERGATQSATEALIDRLPDVLERVRTMADFVVIDTAPLGEVSDALPLLRAVDHVVVVARPGHTDRSSFETMRDLLRRMQAPVSGLLVVGGSHVQRRSYARPAEAGSGLDAVAEQRVPRRSRRGPRGGAPRPVEDQLPRRGQVGAGGRTDVSTTRSGRGR